MTLYVQTIAHFDAIIEREKERLESALKNTILYDVRTLDIFVSDQTKNKQIIEVKNMDTFDLAKEMLDNGFNPLVLNLASDIKPGGGWKNNKTAQEESLFFRSTYALSLDNELIKQFMKITRNDNFYPLEWYEEIYSPDIYVFKDSEYSKMKPKDYYYVNCLAAVGLRNPKYLSNGKLKNEEDHNKLKEKIKGIFKIAKLKNHDCLVLGALGCGVFNNDPIHVSNLFKEVIEEYECDRDFKIVFAVKCGRDKTNYNVFLNNLTKQL